MLLQADVVLAAHRGAACADDRQHAWRGQRLVEGVGWVGVGRRRSRGRLPGRCTPTPACPTPGLLPQALKVEASAALGDREYVIWISPREAIQKWELRGQGPRARGTMRGGPGPGEGPISGRGRWRRGSGGPLRQQVSELQLEIRGRGALGWRPPARLQDIIPGRQGRGQWRGQNSRKSRRGTETNRER